MAATLTLRALTGDLRGQEFTFRAPARCVLGRSRNCHLRLPRDTTVSRQHCLFELDREGAWVQDLGSLNGTRVNGQNIGRRPPGRGGDSTIPEPSRHPLHDGDELRVCNNVFAVVLAEGETPSREASAAAASPGRSR